MDGDALPHGLVAHSKMPMEASFTLPMARFARFLISGIL
jgi:hypothetical protein